ncbi:MAG TPA: mannan-binding lectin [Sphingomicrobium sp.]|nr:mannan-binding lectin [Sphingomicrobium sp.]
MHRLRSKFVAILCAAAPAAMLLGPEPAMGKEREIEAGPIWNQFDADRKCPEVARKAGGTWTGQWRTTQPGRMSVCEVKGGGGGGGKGKTIEVGPIWNQMDAERKCPEAARKAGATWTGQWWTTQPGRMSVCEVKR